MSRLRRPLTAALLLSGITLSGIPFASQLVHRAAARSAGLQLQPTLTATRAIGGAPAGLFVHAPAYTQLSLSITYPDSTSAHYSGKTDGQGRYVFSWHVPAALKQAGDAELHLSARRDSLSASWSGALVVQPAPLPPLFVRSTASHFLAGTTVGFFVSTAAKGHFSYQIATLDGKAIAHGTAIADARGRSVIEVSDTYLPRKQSAAIARVTVSGATGSLTRTARFTLLPRPPLPLSVRIGHAVIRSGDPLTVSVSSAPGTEVQLTVAVTSKTVVRVSGETNASGRWTYSATLSLPLTHNASAQVVVSAVHGIDRASDHTLFTVQPPRSGITDRLASGVDPTPNLSRFFTQVPDKVILVSTEGQSLRAYSHGVLVHETYVTTGRPELPTPHGTFQVMAKYTPYEFISPWPAGSPFYYPPSWTHYAMLFRDGGYFIHDAPWRKVYGPGTNVPHYTLDPGEPVGTHGCVNAPYADMLWLWNWTTPGTTVVVY